MDVGPTLAATPLNQRRHLAGIRTCGRRGRRVALGKLQPVGGNFRSHWRLYPADASESVVWLRSTGLAGEVLHAGGQDTLPVRGAVRFHARCQPSRRPKPRRLLRALQRVGCGQCLRFSRTAISASFPRLLLQREQPGIRRAAGRLGDLRRALLRPFGSVEAHRRAALQRGQQARERYERVVQLGECERGAWRRAGTEPDLAAQRFVRGNGRHGVQSSRRTLERNFKQDVGVLGRSGRVCGQRVDGHRFDRGGGRRPGDRATDRGGAAADPAPSSSPGGSARCRRSFRPPSGRCCPRIRR